MRRAVGAATVTVLISALLLLVSSCGSDAPATKETAPPGEEITVTPDSIEFGDRLVRVGQVGWAGRVAAEDGDVYVLTGRDGEPPDTGDTSSAVLAAFDDAGVERWRTELDGKPSDLAIADGDPWVSHGDGTVTRIDSSDGRILDHVTIEHTVAGYLPMVAAFGSLWATPEDSQGRSSRLVRIDPDLSTTTIELDGDGYVGDGPAAGAGAIWFPLGEDHGVARIDPDTNTVTVISVDDLGHEARIAVDGDVVYVAPGYRVTSIVDGEVRATVATGPIDYLGPIEGVFGVLDRAGQFRVLGADDQMVREFRDVSTEGQRGPAIEIDGDAWAMTGENNDLRRLEFLPASG